METTMTVLPPLPFLYLFSAYLITTHRQCRQVNHSLCRQLMVTRGFIEDLCGRPRQR
jgi:hypothetical protein